MKRFHLAIVLRAARASRERESSDAGNLHRRLAKQRAAVVFRQTALIVGHGAELRQNRRAVRMPYALLGVVSARHPADAGPDFALQLQLFGPLASVVVDPGIENLE